MLSYLNIDLYNVLYIELTARHLSFPSFAQLCLWTNSTSVRLLVNSRQEEESNRRAQQLQ